MAAHLRLFIAICAIPPTMPSLEERGFKVCENGKILTENQIKLAKFLKIVYTNKVF